MAVVGSLVRSFSTPLLSLALLGALPACGGEVTDEPIPLDDRAALIDAFVAGLDALPSTPSELASNGTSAAERDGDFSCTTESLSETRQFDRIVAYAANSDGLWPGSIIRGDSIYDGLFTQQVFDRAPLNFSVSLESLDGNQSARMEAPSLSTFRDRLGEVLAREVDGATPANIYAELEEVHSQQQLELALSASASWIGAGSIAASFDFNHEQTRSRYLVKYMQAYYTVDVDAPSTPSSFFADSVTVDDLEPQMAQDNPPVYVSSITYGRMIVFTFESAYSATELGAALEFAYRGGVDVSGDVSVTYKDILAQSNITAFILGGSGGDAAQSIDSYEGLMDFIKTGGNYSKDSPGAPISYRLSYLRDHSPARMSLTTEYQTRECTRVSQKVKVTLKNFEVLDSGDNGDTAEIYGRAVARVGGQEVVLWDRAESGFVAIREGATFPTNGTPLGETLLDVEPQAGKAITLAASMTENDSGLFSSDDTLGSQTFSARFETGWRRDVKLLMTGDGGTTVQVTFALEPI